MNFSNFDRDFAQSQRKVNWMFRIAASIIAVSCVATVVFWIFAATVAVKTVDQVDEVGLKTVIENIWCGKGKSCL